MFTNAPESNLDLLTVIIDCIPRKSLRNIDLYEHKSPAPGT